MFKIIKIVFGIALIGAVIIIALGSYFVFIPQGSAFLGRILMARIAPGYRPDPGHFQGSLANGLFYENLEIPLQPHENFTKDYVLRIERLGIQIKSFHPRDAEIDLQNARIIVPMGDPLICSGTYRQGRMDFNFYARTVSLRQMIGFIPDPPRAWRQYDGSFSDIDLYIQGSMDEIRLSGKLHIDDFKNNGFLARDSKADVQITLASPGSDGKLKGFIQFQGGIISGPRTALVHLQKGRLIFDSMDPENPDLDFTAWAQVEKVKMNIRLGGALKNPQIILTSQPSMPQPRLLMMLATNRSWAGTEAALFDRKISVDLAKDFIDYFVFSGSGSQMARKFGIKDFFVKYTKDVQGFGVTKSITDSVDAIYEVEQRPTDVQGQLTREHKIGGSVQILDKLSVTAKQGFKQKTTTDQQDEAAPEARGESEVELKFQQQF